MSIAMRILGAAIGVGIVLGGFAIYNPWEVSQTVIYVISGVSGAIGLIGGPHAIEIVLHVF